MRRSIALWLLLPLALAGCRESAPARAAVPEQIDEPIVEADERPVDRQLFEAIGKGSVAEVKAALAAGADPNANQANGWRPLLTLGIGDDGKDTRLEVARLLIEKGAEVNYRQPDQGWTPLTMAINGGVDPLPLIRFLIEKGAKVDIPMTDGTRALHLAARSGNVPVIKELIRHGADVEARTIEEPTPSSAYQDEPFGQKMNRMERDSKEMVARHYEPGFRLSGQTPLFFLPREGAREVVQALFAAGARVNAKDDNGWTPLHHAVRMSNLEAVHALFAAGADVNASSNGGFRPLHLAMRAGFGLPSPFESVIDLLLREGADLNARNREGLRPADLLRQDAEQTLREARSNPSKQLPEPYLTGYLELVNRTLKRFDPSASPVTLPPPILGERGTRYADLELVFSVFERAVRVEGGFAVLELVLKGPADTHVFTIDEIHLDNYEPITPMPLKVDLNRSKKILIRFPKEAAGGGGVSVKWSTENGSGEQNEGQNTSPMFVSGDGPLSVSHEVTGRTMVFRIDSATVGGKSVAAVAGKEFQVPAGKKVPLPGLARPKAGEIHLQYRFRLLPNKRWESGDIGL